MPASTRKPACSNWGLWEGPECELPQDGGQLTLFVRDASPETVRACVVRYAAVWFCEEYRDWGTVREVLATGVPVTIACWQESFDAIPPDLRAAVRLVVRVRGLGTLKPQDVVTVGSAFSPCSFIVGFGARATCVDYEKDRRL